MGGGWRGLRTCGGSGGEDTKGKAGFGAPAPLDAAKSSDEGSGGDADEGVELMARDRREATTRALWMDEARDADVQRELTEGVEIVDPCPRLRESASSLSALPSLFPASLPEL